jgi:hypothetical protein
MTIGLVSVALILCSASRSLAVGYFGGAIGLG